MRCCDHPDLSEEQQILEDRVARLEDVAVYDA